MTHSSCHWEEGFLLGIVDLYSRSKPYAILIYRSFIQNIPYLILLPYLEIAKTHSFYFHFPLTSKSFLSFLLVRSICSSKTNRRKDNSPNYIEISKNQTRIGRFVWFLKSYKWKNYFEPCFQLLKINDLGQFEKSQ